MTLWLALVAGSGLGYVLARGDFCFHSTWRQIALVPRDASLAKAYLVLLLVSTPVVQLMRSTGFIDPFVPPLAWPAALVGGTMFGVGMVIAKTCVSGMFYKFAMGMVGSLVAIAGWAIGDVVTWQGLLQGLRESLTSNPVLTTENDQSTSSVTLLNAGIAWWVIALLAGAAMVLVVSRSTSRFSWILGIATAVVMVIGWALVRWHGGNYSFGTAGVPNTVWNWLSGRGDDTDWWIPLALISVVIGAVIYAVTSSNVWIRGETVRRYAELGGGGFVMGVGAAIAGGCNLGHSMVGVPLLSAGSIVTTLAIIAGVVVTTRLLHLQRGQEPQSAQLSDAPNRRSADS